MLSLAGILGFSQPWVLVALVALPGLWWLLRLLPPPPQRARFPAIALLEGLLERAESAARMPWWLLALRMLIAALVILALSDPVLAPQQRLRGKGPVVIVVDNGWAAGQDWQKRQTVLANILDEAQRSDRGILVLPTAMAATAADGISIKPASDWRAVAGAMRPHPWLTDRKTPLHLLANLSGPAESIWLTDGLETAGRMELAERLQRLGQLVVYTGQSDPMVLQEPLPANQGLRITAARAIATQPQTVEVLATAADGRTLASMSLPFAAGEKRAEASWQLPTGMVNQVQRLQLAGANHAGGTVLLDSRWAQRTVGLVSTGNARAGHPLLDPAHYIRSAFSGLAAFSEGEFETVLAANPSILVLRERLEPAPALAAKLDAWLASGGMLLRFASAGLSERPDTWLPVALRPLSRSLGGTLSWDAPQKMAAFPDTSPFAGLAIPADVTVKRQILAEPEPGLRDKTWASLADGTPLVTAQQRNGGWIVLVHVSPDTDWSTLPLSGLFLEMLGRLIWLSQGSPDFLIADQPLPPQRVLDGFGNLQDPTPDVRPLPARPTPALAPPSAVHPPGYYGNKQAPMAWNLAPALTETALAPISDWPGGVAVRSLDERRSQDLGAWLLLAALVLLLTDTVLSLWLRGHFRRSSTRAASFGIAAMMLATAATQAVKPANASDDLALKATMETHLAYVVTGDAGVDRTSAAGLNGLGKVLTARTTIEPGPAIPIDIESTELAFFPLIYWPIVPGQPDLSASAKERVSSFLEHGGTILFDTRDQDAGGVGGPGGARLRSLLAGVRIPPLQPIPGDHVLTRSFYLLRDFPGRWSGGPLWVETDAADSRDDVSGVIIGRNDWAAAWAMDADWRPLFPVYPGGQRQREFAYRFGVNLAMYVLTGNYKSDQVHVPDILKRLGQ